MIFRNLPQVISDHILSFLHVNDLLRLRLVSKASKNLADDYLRVYGTSRKVVSLNADELTNFLALTYPLPLNRLNLDNEDMSIWNWEEMHTFSSLYGDKITHLKMSRLDIPIERPELVQFFEGLFNLKSLRIETVHNTYSPDSDQVPPQLDLPSTFKRLQNLHVNVYFCCPVLQCVQLLGTFVEECSPHLQSVNHPILDFNCHLKYRNIGIVDFDWLGWIVDKRHRENPDKPNLKCVDLENFRDYRSEGYARRFYELVTTCSTHGVKLQNVDARWIEAMMQLDTPDRGLHGDNISRCVVSIKHLTKSLVCLELPFLEEIDIKYTSSCSMPEGDFEAKPWMNLKKLRFMVNCAFLAHDADRERASVSRLIEFFFHGILRENLESLKLHIDTYQVEILPYPEITNVCSSCPNLKKLHFREWPGSDRDIAQLWENLTLLEDVTFENCKRLRDAAFIGDDVTRPAILKTTRLRSLELWKLENMPGITDTLFTVALQHMQLKTLHLKSKWVPISSITLAGLESLLTGQFAETIENFPLKGKIELKGVTEEQLIELEGKFRSSQMKCGRV